jgi:NADH:ubiquinone oxidoreductase subunit 5 (subunit L)/multisubunit Na+/H+ antiporter MnhA subunit
MALWLLLSCIALPGFWLTMGWLGGNARDHRQLARWTRVASWGNGLLLLALALLALLVLSRTLVVPEATLFKLHALNSVVLLLVLFVGALLTRFARHYLAGEACYPRFFRWMMLTLTAVVVTLMANHLVLFWLGWVAISLSLHRLLTLYDGRPRAVMAAHKKFILARMAESSVLTAFGLLYWQHGTWYLDQLLASLRAAEGASLPDQGAAILLVLAALIKCAQLPVHGWLIKVVEAPTPVSALLHAGIINLGGYLLLLFAPLLSLVSAAQWLLAVVAGLSATLAALIMTTRVSIKVRLAWSTCAQMGLMLVQCALGLYALALLHLVAHSLYKAFAFLHAGNAVYQQLQQNLVAPPAPAARHWLAGAAVSGLAVSLAWWLSGWQGALSPWWLLALAMTWLFAQHSAALPGTRWHRSALLVVLLVGSYSLFKQALEAGVMPSLPVAPGSALDIWVLTLFTLLFALSAALTFRRDLAWIQRLSSVLFAGLYLDEWFTRVTQRLWPATLPEPRHIHRHRGPAAVLTHLETTA